MRHIKTYKTYEGKGPKGKDLTVFVRFGGLDLKTQKGYTQKDSSFHAPPAARGFYAMPKVAQEMFLVGSIDSFQPGTMPKTPEYPEHKEYKDEEGKMKLSPEDLEKWRKERDAFDWDKHGEATKKRMSEIRKEFKKTEGNIWHHFVDYVPHNEVIERHGSWVKTSIKTWQKAFMKDSMNGRYGEDFGGTEKGRGYDSINKGRGINGYYSKDHYEVFFDEKV